MTKTQEREMPELVWADDSKAWAKVGEYFGSGWAYQAFHYRGSFRWMFCYDGGLQQEVDNVDYETIAEAKQAAQQHFHARLSEPMGFGEAMAAVARGCDVRRAGLEDGCHVKQDGPWAVTINSRGESEGDIGGKLEHFTATDWHFYFPSKPA